MVIFVTVIHVVVALFMVLVVLVQGGNQGGIGAAFGGGNSSGVFGATGATSFLAKLTYGAAIIFMMTSLSLAFLQGKPAGVGLGEKLKARDAATPAATQEAPAQQPAAGTPSAPAPAAGETATPGGQQQPATEMPQNQAQPAGSTPPAAPSGK